MKTGKIVVGTVGGLHYQLGYCDEGHKITATRAEITSLFAIADKGVLQELSRRKNLRVRIGRKLMGSSDSL